MDGMREALASHYLFADWPAADLAELAALAREATARRGERLFLEEEPCRALWLLLEGRVSMTRSHADGRETTLATIGPGGLVGCAALFLDRRFPATARVVSPGARLLVIEGTPLLAMLDRRPRLARGLIGALAERLMMISARLESLQSASTLERLAGWLLEQPSRPGPGGRTVALPSSRKALAAALGMTPESFSRGQAELARRNLVRADRKSFTILDLKGLQGVAERPGDSD